MIVGMQCGAPLRRQMRNDLIDMMPGSKQAF